MSYIAFVLPNDLVHSVCVFDDNVTEQTLDYFAAAIGAARWEDVTLLAPRPAAGWTWVQDSAPVPPAPVPVVVRYLTASQFVQRFTVDEWETICSHTAPLAKGFVARLSVCPTVDLLDDKLASVLDRAVTAGILTNERRDAILATTPDDS